MSAETSTASRRQLFGAAALGLLAASVSSAAEAKAPAADGPLTPLLKVIEAHDAAFAAHDLDGVLATMTDDVFVLGSGPTEIWKGSKEVAGAYTHFFEAFPKNVAKIAPTFYEGSVRDRFGWIMAVTRITASKGDQKRERGLNISVGLVKTDKGWRIRSLHYSSAQPRTAG